MGRTRYLAGLLVALGVLWLAPSAGAALKAKSSLLTAADGTRIVVKLKSTRRLPARARPTAVSVKAGGRTYKLRRARGASAAAVSLGTWRSSPYTGDAAAALIALGGQRLVVSVRSRAGTTNVSSTLPNDGGPEPPPPPPPPPPGSDSLYEPPSRELTGNEAFEHIKRYFLNSRFTDCPGGWPTCAVEEIYRHCANFDWEYHRYTSVSGADINSYGYLNVSGVAAHTDGSWAIEYVTTAYGNQTFYHWEVAKNGVATGYYQGNSSGQLGPLRVLQPANCGA